ncbi:Carboxypeptidase regulatory-like domain-containing protein [Terriglobus roseus]|uniref:Carboxypeptidase regulatory-like domain-containing protein n=2 Tax=Terriglobus roseus TaxID=392734 RepID=A0A1H4IYZ0_9BACT|nr:Carboxypeptidase regulatory-like domain-containing protein [Terriglobus roseus]
MSAQVANNTSLVGTITDTTGAVVAGAHVTAVNTATKVKYAGTTNEQGFYQIQFVQPGSYDVSVEQSGYSHVTSRGTEVLLNMAARTDVTLKVGSSSTEITVTAETPALSTDDALVGETLTSKQVENLPMASRRVMELASTNPSIIVGPKTSYSGTPPGANYIGAGTREVTNSLTLDGITIMNSLISNSPVTPNADAVGAVQTQTGNYTAQYGAYMGVHINVDTKAGTNSFHGTAFDYVQNTAFNAKSFLASSTAKTPVQHFNQFGFVLDGPVVLPFLYNGRDKLFFMGSYEGVRQKQETTTVATLLTSAMQRGDFSAITTPLRNPAGGFYTNNQVPVSAVAAKLLQYYATPNVAGLTNNANQSVPNSFMQDQTLDRVDYNIGEKVRLFARFDYQTIQTASGNIVPTSASSSPTKNTNGLIAYTHIITPRLINDFRIGFNKLSSNALNYFYTAGLNNAGTALGIPGFNADTANANPGIPTVLITNYTGLGAEGTNWFQDDRTIHGYDQISYNFGKHNIMVGADIRKMSIGRAAGNTPRGQFNFNGSYTGNAAADFIAGDIYQTTTPVYQVKGSVASWRNGFFAQDNWQASQKLTVQYGVRYELPLAPYSLNGFARILNSDYTALIPNSTATTGASFVPTPGFKFVGSNTNLVSPRLGLAYRANEKVVIRGGGGIYYNPNHLNAFTLASTNYPLAASVVYTVANAATAPLTYTNPTGGQGGAAAPVAGTPGTYVSAFTDNHYLPTPRMYQWNLDTGVEMWKGGALELQYLGSKSVYLDRSYYPNQPLPSVAATTNANRPYQLFGQIRQINNDSFSTYNGLSAIYRQHAYKGLDVMLGYTWAHNMDTSSDANGGGTAMIQNNLRADYANSNWDIRNRFVGTVTYAMPEFRKLGLIGNSLLGGWHANGIVTLQGGIPFNVGITDDRAHVLGIGTQRPNFVHLGNSASCGRSTVISKTACIDTTAYALPALGTFGTLHRNDIKGPGFANVNFSMSKDFAIFERLKLQLRGEAFNLFNHANLGNPNSTLPSATTAGAFNFSGSNFGTISQMASGYQPRTLQLAGKINF